LDTLPLECLGDALVLPPASVKPNCRFDDLTPQLRSHELEDRLNRNLAPAGRVEGRGLAL
jgi:hypothetical protein